MNPEHIRYTLNMNKVLSKAKSSKLKQYEVKNLFMLKLNTTS